MMTPIEKNKKWGFANENGDIIVSAIYDHVSKLEDGFVVCKNNKYGLLDNELHWILYPVYDSIFNARIKQGINKVVPYSDESPFVMGKTIVFNGYKDPDRTDWMRTTISNEIVVYKQGELFGLVDRNGRLLLPACYKSVYLCFIPNIVVLRTVDCSIIYNIAEGCELGRFSHVIYLTEKTFLVGNGSCFSVYYLEDGIKNACDFKYEYEDYVFTGGKAVFLKYADASSSKHPQNKWIIVSSSNDMRLDDNVYAEIEPQTNDNTIVACMSYWTQFGYRATHSTWRLLLYNNENQYVTSSWNGDSQPSLVDSCDDADGIVLAINDNKGKIGMSNTRLGSIEFFVPAKYDEVSNVDISRNLCIVRIRECYGILDYRAGREVCPIRYDRRCVLHLFEGADATVVVEDALSHKYGVVDAGTYANIVPEIYDDILKCEIGFICGLGNVKRYGQNGYRIEEPEGTNGLYGEHVCLFGLDGHLVLGPDYSAIAIVSNQLFCSTYSYSFEHGFGLYWQMCDSDGNIISNRREYRFIKLFFDKFYIACEDVIYEKGGGPIVGAMGLCDLYDKNWNLMIGGFDLISIINTKNYGEERDRYVFLLRFLDYDDDVFSKDNSIETLYCCENYRRCDAINKVRQSIPLNDIDINDLYDNFISFPDAYLDSKQLLPRWFALDEKLNSLLLDEEGKSFAFPMGFLFTSDSIDSIPKNLDFAHCSPSPWEFPFVNQNGWIDAKYRSNPSQRLFLGSNKLINGESRTLRSRKYIVFNPNNGPLWGVIVCNRNLQEVLAVEFDKIEESRIDNVVIAKKGNIFYIINLDNVSDMFAFQQRSIKDVLSFDYFVFEENKRVGVADKNENVVVPCDYEWVSLFGAGCFLAKIAKPWGEHAVFKLVDANEGVVLDKIRLTSERDGDFCVVAVENNTEHDTLSVRYINIKTKEQIIICDEDCDYACYKFNQNIYSPRLIQSHIEKYGLDKTRKLLGEVRKVVENLDYECIGDFVHHGWFGSWYGPFKGDKHFGLDPFDYGGNHADVWDAYEDIDGYWNCD